MSTKSRYRVTWVSVTRRGVSVGQHDHFECGIHEGWADVSAFSEAQAKMIIARKIRGIYGRDIFVKGLEAAKTGVVLPRPAAPTLRARIEAPLKVTPNEIIQLQLFPKRA